MPENAKGNSILQETERTIQEIEGQETQHQKSQDKTEFHEADDQDNYMLGKN